MTLKGVAADGNSGGTVTTVSVVTANGLAGSVANATTAPAITLSTTQIGILTGNGTAIAGVSALPVGNGAIHPGYIAGRWYSPVQGQMGAGGTAIAANTVRLLPFTLTQPITISDLGARITTLVSGGNLRLAIYNSDLSICRPTTVAAETGSISTTSSGNVSADITGANVSLVPGLYWMAINADATAGGTLVMQTLAASAPLGGFLIGSATQANVSGASASMSWSLTFSSTFGTFPDLTGQSTTESAAGAPGALILLKAA